MREWVEHTTALIVEACERPKVTRGDIVPLYVALIVASLGCRDRDTAEANEAIIGKWSLSALEFVKAEAWKVVGAARAPGGEG